MNFLRSMIFYILALGFSAELLANSCQLYMVRFIDGMNNEKIVDKKERLWICRDATKKVTRILIKNWDGNTSTIYDSSVIEGTTLGYSFKYGNSFYFRVWTNKNPYTVARYGSGDFLPSSQHGPQKTLFAPTQSEAKQYLSDIQ